MNVLCSEKYILKARKHCVKNVLKYCMRFKMEMMVTSTETGLIYLNFMHQGNTPLFFTSRDAGESGWVT